MEVIIQFGCLAYSTARLEMCRFLLVVIVLNFMMVEKAGVILLSFLNDFINSHIFTLRKLKINICFLDRLHPSPPGGAAGTLPYCQVTARVRGIS